MKSQELPIAGREKTGQTAGSAELAALLHRCRKNPAHDFTAGSCPRRDIWAMAAGICALPAGGPLCVCAADKALIAAALVAALHGGPQVVLPYGFSLHALRETRQHIPFSRLLCDAEGCRFSGAATVTPAMLSRTARLPEQHCRPDEPAVNLFTGGSTGAPRLWSKTPANLLAEAAFLIRRFGITDGDIILSTVPAQHIYGLLFSVLVPLVCGCSVLAPLYSFPQEIVAAAREQRASVLVSVPVQYHALQASSVGRHALRLAFSSAGELHPQDAAFFYDTTGIPVTEIFGSTETGGIAWRDSPAENPAWQPFAAVDVKIKNSRIMVRSAYLSPELPRTGDGFFITADRAEPCGEQGFMLKGRADTVIKVGGRRVDLAEVCTKIKQLDGVDDAVVFVLQTRRGRGCETAAFVAGSLNASQLRQRLAAVCEPYAIPRHIQVGAAIPVLASGKYDRAAIQGFFIS